ncbi:uncharacterized protein F4812DRAFT_446963 [Daldinia caldariorum]|uniref:uncharacterized protein n=1 Tax=Daldinia caldariorum TaxID=326644 RepID=UPI002007D148|nr:uncharacterized protein F4812DRAFT_446963 [Daldinia caldariorum]KAI1463444.1 hypothetical protein F4812DRAFT_446963 [Daldinia caldariorum]
MDFINKITGSKDNEEKKPSENQQQESSSGGIMDKINSMAGGGKESEKNEDVLDKGVDWVQEHILGQGDQSNESAVEQAKDEQISDYIRDQYKKTTGSDLPIKDKDRF